MTDEPTEQPSLQDQPKAADQPGAGEALPWGAAPPPPPVPVPPSPAAPVPQAPPAVISPQAPAPSPAGWPAGWGAPPPVWSPPAAAHARRGAGRPLLIVGAGMLAVGIGAGALITEVFARGTSTPGTATIAVDSNPISLGVGGGSNAVSVAQQLGPAVGTVIAQHTDSSSDSLGSGFVISMTGGTSYLLTNNHVVSGATDLHVVMPGGKNLKATLVGTDTRDDLAVVSVPANLPTAVFGKSSDLKVGQEVVAIGSPLGNQGSVTSGVISALHRTINAGGSGGTSSETLLDVLQTDASINPGNSGGPLADSAGRVIGVNVAIAGQGTNIGFSIPSDFASQVAQSLIKHETVHHPFIGIGYYDAIAATEKGKAFDGPGVYVNDVVSGSPADKAGIKTGDVVSAIDGISLDNGQTVGGVLERHKVGDTIKFDLNRSGKNLTVNVTLVDRPAGT